MNRSQARIPRGLAAILSVRGTSRGTMSRKGAVGPLRVSRHHAAAVGELIASRIVNQVTAGTPLAALPSFARKLTKASMRKRRNEDAELAIWTIDRSEAFAGFAYLGWLLRPDVTELVTPVEAASVGVVARAVAELLTAKRGPGRLTRPQAESRIRVDRASRHKQRDWEQPDAAAAADADALDDRWLQRLKVRLAREDAWNHTPLNRIPRVVQDLLSGKKTPAN